MQSARASERSPPPVEDVELERVDQLVGQDMIEVAVGAGERQRHPPLARTR